MTAPSHIFSHYLEPHKGHTANMNALDYQAKVASAVTFTIPWGRVVHLDADGQFRTGISGAQMAIFCWGGQGRLDVTNPGDNSIPTVFSQQAVAPSGVLNGLVATGALELGSTEFDQSQTYAPGDLLTAASDDTDAAVGGVLTNNNGSGAVTQYEDAVCGHVSKGAVGINHYGVKMLYFWSCYLPASAA